MHRAGFIRASFGNCFRAFHHEAAAFFANIAGRLCFDREFAFRIVRTGVKDPESSAALADVAGLAVRASYPGSLFGFVCLIAFYKFAFRVSGTGNKCACAIAAFSHD